MGGERWRGEIENLRAFSRVLDGAEVRRDFRPQALARALASIDRETSAGPARGWLRDALLADDANTRERVNQRRDLWEKHLALRRSLPTAMVMQELPQPRPAFVLKRGQYDAPGDPVEPGVPETLIAAWPAGAPRNRLGLARWLTQPQHPLDD